MKGRHSESESVSNSESEPKVKINSHGRPVAEKTVTVDLEGSCNMVTYIWSVEDIILSSIPGIAEPSSVNLLQL